jgi:hypothetical protein
MATAVYVNEISVTLPNSSMDGYKTSTLGIRHWDRFTIPISAQANLEITFIPLFVVFYEILLTGEQGVFDSIVSYSWCISE